jgi:hypothetical protein
MWVCFVTEMQMSREQDEFSQGQHNPEDMQANETQEPQSGVMAGAITRLLQARRGSQRRVVRLTILAELHHS